jgi:hypothetical protein
MDMACGCLIKGESQRQSCANGLLTEMRVHSAHLMSEAKPSTSDTSRRPSHAYLGR